MNPPAPLLLFEAFGIELEYMIVAADTLAVRPITDRVLHDAAGEYLSEVEMGSISWSNELALHVIELKTTGPTTTLENLPQQFQQHVQRINQLLHPYDARLMPTAMHPWMDPRHELALWPHEYHEIYETFHRIFDCRRHGWANLQSVHLNLPFAGDDEFGRLHAAIRVLLPIMPALAASSPLIEGRFTGFCDTRLDVYRMNQHRIPSIAGQVIPEAVFSRREYEEKIFQRMYADIVPYDPSGVLQHEWLNARGAIARFDRSTIEVRVLDMQECPLADLAIQAAIVEVLRQLVDESWSTTRQQQAIENEILVRVLDGTTKDAERAVIREALYLSLFGIDASVPMEAGALCRQLIERTGVTRNDLWREPLNVIMNEGPLARRILSHLGGRPHREQIEAVYRQLCECLATGRVFRCEQ